MILRSRDQSHPWKFHAPGSAWPLEAGWGKPRQCSILYRPLLAISAAFALRSAIARRPDSGFDSCFSDRVVTAAFLRRGQSAGRVVPCFLSNRPARLPRKCCAQHAEAVCDLLSLSPIGAASASTTTSLPAARAMKCRRMCSTVPEHFAAAPVAKCITLKQLAAELHNAAWRRLRGRCMRDKNVKFARRGHGTSVQGR